MRVSRIRLQVPFRHRHTRLRRLLVGLTVVAGVTTQLLAASPPADAAATYSQVVTLPVPPASSFAGNSGGDGWDVALTANRVYNIFHHQALTLACLNQLDALPCWTPQLIVDGNNHSFAASNHSGTDLDQATGLIHTYAARDDGVGGVVCLDPTAPDQVPPANPYCGFAELTGAGEAQVNDAAPGSPMLVGTRYYAYNSNQLTTGAQNKLLCYDFATSAACPGQPYAIDGIEDSVSVAHVAIGGKLILRDNDSPKVGCFDPATSAECAGSWPVTAPAGDQGAPFPVLDAGGAVIGACMPGAVTCFAMDGSIIAAPAGIPADMGGHYYTGGAVTVGARVFTPGTGPDRVDCYDYSVGAVCAGFPKVLTDASFMYTVNTDPFRPACLWVNSDNGASQIQAFDAFSGEGCGQGGIRVLVSQFVVDQVQCFPSEYQSLELLAPSPLDYTSASIEFLTTNGGPTGIPAQSFDANGVVDLSGLGLETQPSLPQFLISIDGASNVGEVSSRLNWNADYDPSCTGPDTNIVLEPTVVSPTITGGGTTGTAVSVLTGESATANAALSGTNAAGATGSVTYTWYSDSACSAVASQGIAQVITANGVLPDSEPVNLPDGTYYVTVSFSGDAANETSVSTCGDAVLTVGSATNAAPVVDAGTDQSIATGDTVNLSGSFDDPDGSPDWSIVIDWGDGTTEPPSTAAAVGAISGSHLYPDPGSFAVEVCVTDSDGATGCDTMNTTVNVVVVAATCRGLVVTIDMNTNGGNGIGTSGPDVILGTPGNDRIDAGDGDDTVCAGDGDDRVRGGRGDDVLFGGNGRDVLRGNPGADRLEGEGGDDRLHGGSGDDTLVGGEGDDFLNGAGGADDISGGAGNDIGFGGFGADTMSGGPGNDTLRGLVGDDVIKGDAGNDVLDGDRGNDQIDGGAGNDHIFGGNANDVLNGNRGNDVVSGGKADDTLSGGPDFDVCNGNLHITGDTADASCELTFGVP